MVDESKNKINLFFWCNHGYGDTLIMIPIIDKFIEKFGAEFNIHVGVHDEVSYLFKHFENITIHSFECQFRRSISFVSFVPKDYLPIYVWLGHPFYTKQYKDGSHDPYQWLRLVEIVNSQFQLNNLSIKIDIGEKWPEIKLPHVDLNVQNNTIFVENGECYSNQNTFDFDVVRIADEFPNLNFIVTREPNKTKDNIDFDSKRNLIDYQNLLKKCKMFIGKGSGPSHLNYLYEIENMPKALFGYKLRQRHKYWANDFPYEYYSGSYDEIYKFINKNYNLFH